MRLSKTLKSIAAIALFACFSIGAQAEDTTPVTAKVVVTIVNTSLGSLFADVDGKTLYTFDADQNGESRCYGGCAAVWPPVLTDLETVSAPFGTTLRTDGAKQLTLNGSPVYLYASDVNTGDVLGDGLRGVWHVIKLPTP
jgi:predicted lipoprotein with Yx(FWY)xxD motif